MADTRRIVVLTIDAGFGHRSAAKAIAAALQEVHQDECTVEVVNPLDDRRVPRLLRRSQADYDRVVREMPKLYKLSYQASDALVPSKIVEGALVLILLDVMRDIMRRLGPHAIVTTYPLFQPALGALAALRRGHVPLLTVVTDLAAVHRLWFHEAADLCIVPTPAVRELALQCGLAPERVRVVGIPVNPRLARRDPNRQELRAALGWRPDLTTVLAVGSKRVGGLAEVLHAINHSGLLVQVVAVAGRNDELFDRLAAEDWHVPVHLYHYVADMADMLHAADCLVCKAGGLIVTEGLAGGLPLLLIDILPGQEVGNAEFVVAGGAGEYGQGPLQTLEILHHWLANNGELLAVRAQNASRLGRPRAAYDIAEMVRDAAWGETGDTG